MQLWSLLEGLSRLAATRAPQPSLWTFSTQPLLLPTTAPWYAAPVAAASKPSMQQCAACDAGRASMPQPKLAALWHASAHGWSPQIPPKRFASSTAMCVWWRTQAGQSGQACLIAAATLGIYLAPLIFQSAVLCLACWVSLVVRVLLYG